MIPASLTNMQKVERALEMAGEHGLDSSQIATVTQLEVKVVAWTLQNLRSAGRARYDGEPGQHNRTWFIAHRERPDAVHPDQADPLTRFDESDQKFAQRMRLSHPHGYEDARLMPRARLVGNRVA